MVFKEDAKMTKRNKILFLLDLDADRFVKLFLDSGDAWYTVTREPGDPFLTRDMRRAFAKAAYPFRNKMVLVCRGPNIYMVLRDVYDRGAFDVSKGKRSGE